MENKKIPQHNTFLIRNKLPDQSVQDIIFDSDFDSGNLKKVERWSYN